MLKTLIKIRFAAMFFGMFRGSKTKKKTSLGIKVLIGFFAIYLLACFLGMFGALFDLICVPFKEGGISWLYFTLTGVTSLAVMCITGAFSAYSQIFEARDNELLISMPIPSKLILTSRLVAIFVPHFIFNLVICLPVGVVYLIHYSASVIGIVMFVAMFLILPLLGLAISCLIGWVIGWIASKFRNKTVVTTLISLGFMALYFVIYANMNRYIQMLTTHGGEVAAQIQNSGWAFLYWFGNAIAQHNLLHFLAYAIFCVVAFYVSYEALLLSFTHIATTKRGMPKILYREKSMTVSNARVALLKRELAHFISNPMYMLNSGLGVVFIVVGACILAIKSEFIYTMLRNIPEIKQYLGVAAACALCLLSSTVFISAPSISLEGKSLWIVKSCPIDTKYILRAKANMHLVIVLPTVIFAQIVVACVFKLAFVNTLLLFAFPIVYNIFCAYLGVYCNLLLPKFDWVSETVAVKQGASSLVVMLIAMCAEAIPVVLYIFVFSKVIDVLTYAFIVTAMFGVLSLMLYRYTEKNGKVRFERL